MQHLQYGMKYVEICNSPSLPSFKKHLKTSYLTRAFP